MSKKPFIALADSMKAFFDTNAGKEMDDISKGVLMNHMVNFCQDQNPRFNRERWIGYINGDNGPNGGKVK